MYIAKRKGSNGFHVFDPISDSHKTVLLQIESDLWRAVADNSICLFYQPVMDLANSKLVKMEALTR